MPPEEENRLAWQLGQQHAYGTDAYNEDQQQKQRLADEAAEAGKKAHEDELRRNQVPGPPPPQNPPPAPNKDTTTHENKQKSQRRGIGFKALFLTIPLAFIPFSITHSSPGHATRHLPLWQSVLLAVLIAAIGIPKWRARAAGFLVLALIVFWVLGA